MIDKKNLTRYGIALNMQTAKQSGTLYISDLDGTLLNSSSRLSPVSLKILRAEEKYTICFGDQPVDLSLFEAADMSIAVSNTHPLVKEKADLIIGSNDEDAVARFISEDFLKNRLRD